MRALGLAIRIADNLAVVAYGYKDGLPRAYADNYVEFSATQRVGWVEPLRNPSCSSSAEALWVSLALYLSYALKNEISF